VENLVQAGLLQPEACQLVPVENLVQAGLLQPEACQLVPVGSRGAEQLLLRFLEPRLWQSASQAQYRLGLRRSKSCQG
jgi:hypothetical protein